MLKPEFTKAFFECGVLQTRERFHNNVHIHSRTDRRLVGLVYKEWQSTPPDENKPLAQLRQSPRNFGNVILIDRLHAILLSQCRSITGQ